MVFNILIFSIQLKKIVCSIHCKKSEVSSLAMSNSNLVNGKPETCDRMIRFVCNEANEMLSTHNWHEPFNTRHCYQYITQIYY